DCCNMNEAQRISMKQNFPKLRPLLAIERSNGNHHWFCEKACDMATRTARSKKAGASCFLYGRNRIGFLAYHRNK
ncbi:hypothetical protein, partial [uncultured Subdoligranulum sp.]|uniref:hypothetical protein n=1 Tax=uncultured Subdoligranulum sp. TaxID=512298 RepID=UPI0025CE05B9